ncbi:MAG: hypothetical protein ABIJ16_06975 [Bacteroidota bacterium]
MSTTANRLILLLVLYMTACPAQNAKILSLLSEEDALLISDYHIDSLNIKKIEITEFLSEQERSSPEVNSSIYSRKYEYTFKKGKLSESSWYYSGLDSTGTDHFEQKTNGFSTYSYVFEDYYVYDKEGKLIRVDQNTPHMQERDSLKDIGLIRPEQFLIDNIPVDHFILVNLQEESNCVIWQLTEKRYLKFNIYKP